MRSPLYQTAAPASETVSSLAGDEEKYCLALEAGEAAHEGWSVAFDDVSFSIGGKKILENVSGRVEPGQMLAIIGPSGSGKSSLLDALAGRLPTSRKTRISGTVHFGSTQVPANRAMPSLTAYVPQDDTGVIGGLSVRANLEYAAALRVGSTLSASERIRRVTELLAALGLTGAADRTVGHLFAKGISGGQKRRLSTGLELIRMPGVLLLDEITSGLDASAAFKVVQCLQELTQTNQIRVICSIHQPSQRLHSLFSHTMCLVSGRVAYFGRTAGLDAALARVGFPCPPFESPAEHVAFLLNTDFEVSGAARLQAKEAVDRLVTDAAQLSYPELRSVLNLQSSLQSPPQHDRPQNGLRQSYVLTRRMMSTLLRDPAAFWIRLILNIPTAALAGSVWYRLPDVAEQSSNLMSAFFFVMLAAAFNSLTGITTMLQQRSLFLHEHRNGVYGGVPFFISSLVATLPFLLLQTLTAGPIAYFMYNALATWKAAASYLVLFFLTTVCAEGFTLFTVYGMPVTAGASANGVMNFGAAIMLSGILVRPVPSWWKWVQACNFFTLYFRGVMYTQYEGRNVICANGISEACPNGFKTVDELLEGLSLTVHPFGYNVSLLVAVAAAFFLLFGLHIFILVLKTRTSGKTRPSSARTVAGGGEPGQEILDAIIVGAGSSGLATGKYLQDRGGKFVIFEGGTSAGQRWLHRYQFTSITSPKSFINLPGMALPSSWPAYCSFSQYAYYLDSYARCQQLPIRYETTVSSARLVDGVWIVITSDGVSHLARELVVATGWLSSPSIPDIPGLDRFGPLVFHSDEIPPLEELRRKRVVVVGLGNSGSDVGVGLMEKASCEVTFAIRTVPMICPHKLFGFSIQWISQNITDHVPNWMTDLMAKQSMMLTMGPNWTQYFPPGLKRWTPTGAVRIPTLDMFGTLSRAIKRREVKIVSGPRSFDVGGFVDLEGTWHEADVVILATGFEQVMPDWLDPSSVDRAHKIGMRQIVSNPIRQAQKQALAAARSIMGCR